MRRLFVAPHAPDVRPALLSVWVGLLLLLLPFLLLTTSPEKLTAIDLQLSGGGAPSPARVLESIEVRAAGADLEVHAAVRRTDVHAAAGDVERRVIRIPGSGRADLAGLQAALGRLQALDPAQTRIRVVPDDGMPTADLVQLLDAVRVRDGRDLFPDVELAEAGAP